MAEYLLLLIGDEAGYAALDEKATEALLAAHGTFTEAIEAAGVPVRYGAELDLSGTARTVRPDGAGFTVTDGPYAEAKEQLGGLYVIDVPTIEEAVEWAKRIPLLPGDAIEVRPAR